ncbi:MAG: hypothetical protein ACRDQU_16665 [Pseudonocardiaceae bacterium]
MCAAAPAPTPRAQSKRLDSVADHSGVVSEAQHLAMRADTRLLSTLLGETLVRQGGEELLELVEQVRRLARTGLLDRRVHPPELDRGERAALLSRELAGRRLLTARSAVSCATPPPCTGSGCGCSTAAVTRSVGAVGQPGRRWPLRRTARSTGR